MTLLWSSLLAILFRLFVATAKTSHCVQLTCITRLTEFVTLWLMTECLWPCRAIDMFTASNRIISQVRRWSMQLPSSTTRCAFQPVTMVQNSRDRKECMKSEVNEYLLIASAHRRVGQPRRASKPCAADVAANKLCQCSLHQYWLYEAVHWKSFCCFQFFCMLHACTELCLAACK